MKHFKSILFILSIILIILCTSLFSFAMNTGFSTIEVDEESKNRFISDVSFSLLEDEPKGISISQFDISEDEKFAIGGSSITNKKYILIYNSVGEFQYGYTFDCSGSFAVQWSNDGLIVFFVRSDIAALINKDGNIIELRGIKDTEENTYYWNNVVYSSEKSVGNNIYVSKNNMGIFNLFSTSYSQLEKTDSLGNKTIIYNVSARQNVITLICFIAILAVIAIAIYVLTKEIIRLNKKTD